MKVICEKLDYFGRGVVRTAGKTMFVPGLLPSEEAIVRVTHDKKKFMLGEVVEITKFSKSRVTPKCPYENCGCPLKPMSYSDSLEYKKNNVLEILKRFAGIDIKKINITPSEHIYGYRNKVTLKVQGGRLGYFKNETHDLICVDKCFVVSEKINEIIEILKKEDLSLASEIVIKDMDEVMIVIKGDMKIDSLIHYADSIYMNDKLVYGKEKINSTLRDYKFLVSKDSFFQINKDITLKLYYKVLEYAGNGENVVDLFCGVGSISAFLSKQFDKVTGVEINEEAVECAKENMELNGIKNVTFRCGDANKLVSEGDVLVVDPARAGLSKNGIENILNKNFKKIVYVSCNPMSLARDLNEIKKTYQIKKIHLFDMFPWSYHVETVCLLEKKTI